VSAEINDAIERASTAESETWVNRLTDELIARTNVLEAHFHRARGEVKVAELLVRDPDAAINLTADGHCSLITEKSEPDEEKIGEPVPAVVAAVSERIAALVATETTSEMVARYGALNEALRAVSVASGMAAVREMRDIGLLSFSESIFLISGILDSLVLDESTPTGSARTCRRGSMR
jgi:hypothetical protein